VGGGLRIGEMELNSVLAHGVSAFINESGMERCDKYQYDIDNQSGNIAISNKKNNIYRGYQGDDVVPSQDFSTVETPYAWKLLSQELMAMSLKPTIYTYDNYLSEEDEDNFEDVEVGPMSDDEE
jgi:DNA-directed RNA polymerase beta subunit